MIKRFFIIGLLISSYVEATSSMSGVKDSSKDMDAKVYCSEADSDLMNYQCELILGNKYHNILDIKSNNECGVFKITPVSTDKITVDCNFKSISNIYTYELINNKLLLTEYEYEYFNSPSEFDSFIISRDNILQLNRNISDDISENGNRMVSVGYINKKSYLHDEKFNKTKMYLIDGDKVLVLSTKNDDKNTKWYEIIFFGKKVVNKWILSSDVSYLGVDSSYLIQ